MEEVSRSVVTSLRLLLICQAAGLVLALTAGATLIAHVGQFSECLLFSYKGKQVERSNETKCSSNAVEIPSHFKHCICF